MAHLRTSRRYAYSRPSWTIGSAIDVGGSGVKGALVDTRPGARDGPGACSTPPSRPHPHAIAAAVRVAGRSSSEAKGAIGIGFPRLCVKGWVIYSASNIDTSCIGVDAVESLLRGDRARGHRDQRCRCRRPRRIRFGAAKGAMGTVIVLTFGTGIGSALLVDGRSGPNVELGSDRVRGVQACRAPLLGQGDDRGGPELGRNGGSGPTSS